MIAPLGLAAALSPVMLTEQTVLLASPDGRRVGTRFAIGTALVVAVYVGAIVVDEQGSTITWSPDVVG